MDYTEWLRAHVGQTVTAQIGKCTLRGVLTEDGDQFQVTVGEEQLDDWALVRFTSDDILYTETLTHNTYIDIRCH